MATDERRWAQIKVSATKKICGHLRLCVAEFLSPCDSSAPATKSFADASIMEVPSEATNIAPEEPRTEGTPGVGGVSGFIPPTTAYCGRTLRARLIWFRGKGNRIKHPAHRIPPAAKISTHAEIIRILLVKPVDMFDRLLDALPVETGSSPPQPKD